MLDDIAAARDAALKQISAAATLEDVVHVDQDVLGKRGSLTVLKTRLGSLASHDDRRPPGSELNDAQAEVADALAMRREELRVAERAARIAAERLDLTEHAKAPRRGHTHIVTQAWERLEDVFIGLGFTVAEGPEVETDWYNFEALNMPASHPRATSSTRLFVDHAGAPPGTTVLRTHTSPVQIRAMLDGEPPIYLVAPGRVFRRDTPDATHMPVFHQIEGLVIDRGHQPRPPGRHDRGVHEGVLRRAASRRGCARATSRSPSRRASSTSARRAASGSSSADAAWCTPTCCAPAASTPRSGAASPSASASTAWPRSATSVDDLREMFTGDIRFAEQFYVRPHSFARCARSLRSAELVEVGRRSRPTSAPNPLLPSRVARYRSSRPHAPAAREGFSDEDLACLVG